MKFNVLNEVNGVIKSGSAGTPANADTYIDDVTTQEVEATCHYACIRSVAPYTCAVQSSWQVTAGVAWSCSLHTFAGFFLFPIFFLSVFLGRRERLLGLSPRCD